MENGPEFRIVGNASAEKKAETKKDYENRFFKHIDSLPESIQEEIRKLEYEKSPEQIALITFANIETNKLLEKAGVKPYDVSAENFHIVPPEIYERDFGVGSASVAYKEQAIVFNAKHNRSNIVNFGSSAVHELLHLKGHLSIEIREEENKTVTNFFRQGISVNASMKKEKEAEDHVHFKGLHEAVVSEQEKKIYDVMMQLPMMTEEQKRLNSEEVSELKAKIVKAENESLGDIIWVGKNENEFVIRGYPGQRKVLDFVCAEISREFSEYYSSPEEVFQEFLKAQFTGRLLPIARIVEGTFGKGSFRNLGDMGSDKESPILCLESLRKKRADFSKTSKK